MGACLENSLFFHTVTGGMGVGAEGEQETCIFRDHISFLLNTSDLYISHFLLHCEVLVGVDVAGAWESEVVKAV